MHTARQDLKLDHLYVVYPGDRAFALTSHMTLLPLAQLPTQ